MVEGKRRLVYIKYKDHVLFRNANPDVYKPTVRECVGWVLKENSDAIWVLWDKTVQKIPHEKMRPEESGLVILRSSILEMKNLE